MKKLLAITCSPRKPSNSELFAKAVCKELGEEWELKIVRLIEWNILPCRACYKCLFERCPQNDDMESLIELIVSSDAVALCAPTYFLGANALLKHFVDRGLMFHGSFDKLWGKPMVGVVIAGVQGMDGYAKLMVDSAIKVMGGKLLTSVVVFGAFPGEAVMGEENIKKVRDVAGVLRKGESVQESSIRCPLCGGDSFRFMEANRVKCLLCSNEGHYSVDSDGNFNIFIEKGDHRFFLTYDEAIQHSNWLRHMKKRFLEIRNQLKPIIKELANYGEVVQPPSKDD